MIDEDDVIDCVIYDVAADYGDDIIDEVVSLLYELMDNWSELPDDKLLELIYVDDLIDTAYDNVINDNDIQDRIYETLCDEMDNETAEQLICYRGIEECINEYAYITDNHYPEKPTINFNQLSAGIDIAYNSWNLSANLVKSGVITEIESKIEDGAVRERVKDN